MENEADRKKLGADIAFGMQQTLACWATDFIDPYVGEKIQHCFEDENHKTAPGSTWVGEVVGDSAAFFAFLGVQRLFPAFTQGLKHQARGMLNPLLERTGKKQLKPWVEKEHIDRNSPEYRERMEAWKEFQSDNIAKSLIISASSIAFNVATQKAMHNTHKIGVITMAKVAGASITVAGMLGLRFAIPKSTHQLDEELSERYFSPLIHKGQKLFGAAEDPLPDSKGEEKPDKKHADKIQKRQQPLTLNAR